MTRIRMTATATTLVLTICALPLRASGDWPVFDRDIARSGFAIGDNTITLANVNRLHRRWVAKFDAPADGAPILISNVAISPTVARTLMYQETRIGTTYAIDAHSGSIIWKHTTRGVNITNSMPAEDPSGRWIYAPGVDAHIHKLAASNGSEFFGGGFPLRVTWSPQIEKVGTALNIAHGFLYSTTGGYFGDRGQYDGHLVTLQLSDGHVNVVNSLCYNIHQLISTRGTCPFAGSGIWARGGAVVDPDPSMGGRIYVATGNGRFNANQGGDEYGDSVLAIAADGSSILDSYTPADYAVLGSEDIDLGSTAPVMLPRQATSRTPLMAVQGGKDGILKLLNRQHLGGVGAELQDYNISYEIFTAPAVWVDQVRATWLFVDTSFGLRALQLVTTSGRSLLEGIWSSSIGGTSPIVANGIVFSARNDAVHAFDARNGNVVWSSTQPSAGGTIGLIHWESPIVVNGWLYISDESANLTAYSL